MKRSMRKPIQPAQAGFTIIELLVATLVFSVILVVITSGIIHFTENYYKGLHESSTQTTARNVMNVISQNLQYGGGADAYITNTDTTGETDKYICIGSVQINYKIGPQLGSDGTYGVVVSAVDPLAGCGAYRPGITKGKELLAPKMRLANLCVNNCSGATSGSLYTVNVGIVYGDVDLLCARKITPASTSQGGCGSGAPAFVAGDYSLWNDPVVGASIGCKGGSGSQFCAASRLSTQIVARFKAPT